MSLHHGRLVEQGSHPELLARSGTYARLYELLYAAPGLVPAWTDQDQVGANGSGSATGST